ncbi:MAG: 1-acyl-sn-glycerol-3-phosphate acyltransferase [Alphaproteobacteria bacterium]|nr:1-acyl-sn-glycerol-3-phosphate acyltransferase [Alphaproteobacteria bacterium]
MSEPTDLAARWQEADRRRDRRFLLYAPWAVLGFLLPTIAATLGFGITAVLASVVNQNAGWYVGKAWCRLLLWLNFTRVEVVGREHVVDGQSYVYMLNHQSHFDVPSFYANWRHQFRWVVKEELRRVPGLGWYCTYGGHVFVDRSSRERSIASLTRARERMEREHLSVAFFPEGTRSRDGRMQAFKKGGFIMAQDMGLPILPISVSGSNAVLPGKRLRLLPGRVRITVHPPIDTAAYGGDRERLMADTRAAIAKGLTPWEAGG